MSKRYYMSILWAVLPTLIWFFIMLDIPWGSAEGRAIWLFFTMLTGAVSYTYPGWDE